MIVPLVPGNTLPVESLIVPVREAAVDCAVAGDARTVQRSAKLLNARRRNPIVIARSYANAKRTVRRQPLPRYGCARNSAVHTVTNKDDPMTRTQHLVSALVSVLMVTTADRTAKVVGAEQTRTLTPVTDAMLLNPAPADWPNWRRTLNGWGYSPLNQITTRNVHQLQLVWSWALQPGQSQPTPLVANGMMYIPIPGGGAQALDAATGDFLWEYQAPQVTGVPRRTSPMRTLAIYGDKVY